MSIKKEEQNNSDLGEELFDSNSKPHAKDEALDRVQQELNEEKDKRSEERFYWICGLIILVNLFTFQVMQTWAAPIAVVIIELVFLICLGRTLKVDHIWTLTEKIIEKWNGKIGAK